MKKLLFGALALGMFTACNNDNAVSQNEEIITNNDGLRKSCPSNEIRLEALKNNPELNAKYIALEENTDQFVKNMKLGKVLIDGTVEIPVVVNVLYNTAAQNVSDAVIAEQIAVLNADFTATNSDISKIPTEFKSAAAGNTSVKFRLDRVIRKSTSKTTWATDDTMKKSSTGGLDAVDPAHYFNLWVVGSMGGILGYATFPESAGLWNDGVVIAAPYFGKTGAVSPYNLGRTATHEVGHYLNLRHIWGDGKCATDYCNDTPSQTNENYGKPSYPLYQRCSGVKRSVMFMNYMDYVDDAAMYMFSGEQKARMQAVTSASGNRAGLRLY